FSLYVLPDIALSAQVYDGDAECRDDEPESETDDCASAQGNPCGRRRRGILRQRRLGTHHHQPGQQEHHDEPHLRPENPRSKKGLDVRGEHRQSADHHDDESRDYPPVYRGQLAQMLRAVGNDAANGAQRAAVHGDCESTGEHQTADVQELHDGLGALGVTVVVVPGLEELHERFRKAHRFQSFMAVPLTTVRPIADSATVRCNRRLLASVSASFESLAPAYVNAASAVSIDSTWTVRRTRPWATIRESHQFHNPVTVLTVNIPASVVAPARCTVFAHAGAARLSSYSFFPAIHCTANTGMVPYAVERWIVSRRAYQSLTSITRG